MWFYRNIEAVLTTPVAISFVQMVTLSVAIKYLQN